MVWSAWPIRNSANCDSISSESRGEWKHGFPWDHKAVAEGRALQLLTHAIWWVGPEGRAGLGRLEDLVTAKLGEYNAELAANSDVWARGGKTS